MDIERVSLKRIIRNKLIRINYHWLPLGTKLGSQGAKERKNFHSLCSFVASEFCTTCKYYQLKQIKIKIAIIERLANLGLTNLTSFHSPYQMFPCAPCSISVYHNNSYASCPLWTGHYANFILLCHYCCFIAKPCLTLCDPIDGSMPGFPVLHHLPELLKLMSIESVTPSSHLILWHPLLLLPSIFLTIRVFSNESALRIRWPKYWNFSISPSKKNSGLISFRINWFDLLAVQRTFKSLLQHHSSKASILQCSVFFIVQISHPYMTTRRTIALTVQTFVSKMMSLLFNMVSRFVIAFHPAWSLHWLCEAGLINLLVSNISWWSFTPEGERIFQWTSTLFFPEYLPPSDILIFLFFLHSIRRGILHFSLILQGEAFFSVIYIFQIIFYYRLL